MKSYHALAWKEIKKQRVTSILILIAVILSTMMTTIIGQSLGILQSLRVQQAGMLNGFRYVTFKDLSKSETTKILEDNRMLSVGQNIFLGNVALNNKGISLSIHEFDDTATRNNPSISNVVDGRFPESSGEIALSKNTLKLLEFEGDIGDTITLDLSVSLMKDTEVSYKYQADFILTGILEDNYLAYSSGMVVGFAGKGSGETLLPERYQVYSVEFRTASEKEFQKTVNEIAEELNIGKEYIQYNWIYLNALGITYDEKNSRENNAVGFFFMAVANCLIGSLVLLAAGLVMYNILKISIGKRIREYGTLRALGAEPNQLYLLVLEQILILCIIGIPIGSIIGTFCASGLTQMVTSILTPDIFMANSVEELSELIAANSTIKLKPLFGSIILTLFFGIAAAIPAARYAAKVSPIIAMERTGIKIKRKSRKTKNIRNFPAFFAFLNLKRNPGRSFITILSLVMSSTVFVALTSFSEAIDMSNEVRKLHIGDYAITNESVGFTPDAIEELRGLDDISEISTLKYSLYKQNMEGRLEIKTDFLLKQPYETLQIIGVDMKRLEMLFPGLTDEQKKVLINGKGCLIQNPAVMISDKQNTGGTEFLEGDKISIEGYSLDVIGNTEAVSLSGQGYLVGVQVILYDTIYDKLTGKNTYTEIYPELNDDADTEEFERLVKKMCNQVPGSGYVSYQDTNNQLEESAQQIKMLAWGLIIIIALIGLLNIINTTYTNIHTRVNEIGVQRAIGMCKVELYKVFLWEGVYYALISTLISAVTGYLCTIFIEAAITEKITLVAFPLLSVLEVTIVSIGTCLIATCIPLKKITKMSIVESIETIE